MSKARRLLASSLLAALILAIPSAAAALAAAAPRPISASQGDQIVLSGSVTVAKGTSVDEVVLLHGEVKIAGVAYGDVIVLDGGISIYGQVSGSVIAVNGSVYLGSGAQVLGDVIARGSIRVETGARVDGSIREHSAFTWRTPIALFGRFASWLAVTVSTLALGLSLIFVAPRAADAVFDAARASPWVSLGWGIGVSLGLPVLGLAAVVSLVGLPFGLELMLALAFVFSIGHAYAAFAVGRLLWGPPHNRVIAFCLGWMIARAVALAPVVSGITWVAGAVFGLGAVAVAVRRARATGGKHREGRATQIVGPL